MSASQQTVTLRAAVGDDGGIIEFNGYPFLLEPGDRYCQARVEPDGRVTGVAAWGPGRERHELKAANEEPQ